MYSIKWVPFRFILLTQCYYHRGTRLNDMKKFCVCSLWSALNVLTCFPLTGGCSESLDAFRFFFKVWQESRIRKPKHRTSESKPNGLVDEPKEPWTSAGRNETWVAPRQHVDASRYALLAICSFCHVCCACLVFSFLLLPPYEHGGAGGGCAARLSLLFAFPFSAGHKKAGGLAYYV